MSSVAPSRVLSSGAEITKSQVEELSALLEKATPGPWKSDVRVYSNGCFDAHWSIQTVDKQPEHPWSPRFVAWMTGTVRSDVRLNDIPGAKYCRECDSWHLGWREVGVDVRADPRAEADAKLISAMRNALPALLRIARARTDERSAPAHGTAREPIVSPELIALGEAAVAEKKARNAYAMSDGDQAWSKWKDAEDDVLEAAAAYARSVEERGERAAIPPTGLGE